MANNCKHEDDRIIIEYVEGHIRHVIYECPKCERTVEHTFDEIIEDDWDLFDDL